MYWTSELEWERAYILQLCQESSATTAGSLQDDDFERQHRWSDIWLRIQQHPEVIQPVALMATNAAESSSTCRCAEGFAWNAHLCCENCTKKQEDSNAEKLYSRTILGALCSMDMSSSTIAVENQDVNNDEMKTVRTHPITISDIVRWVLQQCPWQVRCSQVKPGHTPLRDAVCNPTCLPEVLEMLVQADEAVRHGAVGVFNDGAEATTTTQATTITSFSSLLPSVLDLRDSDGLSPVDHLLHMVQLGPYAEATVKRLESLLKYAQVAVDDDRHGEKYYTSNESKSFAGSDLRLTTHSTPLLQLLTMGNSFGITSTLR